MSVSLSIRKLLAVAPSMDVEFYGVTFKWFGLGVIWMRSAGAGRPERDAE